MTSFVAEGVLPYRGLGSGVSRALDAQNALGLKDEATTAARTATRLVPRAYT